MNRRGHLSHKIPNVKLRPAPAPSTSKAANARKRKQRDEYSPEMWRKQYDEDDEDGQDEHMESGSAKPWEGLVITFTGVEDKASLTHLVQEMGGVVESALTVNVTHVVAVDVGSPKYNYAIENGLPVMTPEWITRSHAIWIHGDTWDLYELQDETRMAPFQGLKIAISGIEDLERRKAIKHFVDNFGGVYSKDLDRTCTHLVTPTSASSGKPSEKVKWALTEIASKETARRRGGKKNDRPLKLVYEEWLWDCLGYRGRFKEEDYDARKPRPKGRIRADDVIDGSIFVQEAPVVAAKKEEEVPIVVKRRRRDGLDSLVGEIMTTAAVESKAPAAPTEEPKVDEGDGMDLEDEPVPEAAVERTHGLRPSEKVEPERKPSLLHRTRTAAFDDPAPPTNAKPTPSFSPTGPNVPDIAYQRDANPTRQRTSSPTAVAEVRPVSPVKEELVEGDTAGQPKPDPFFFQGLRFCHIIEEECVGLEEALQTHGGILISEKNRLAGAEVDYIISRLGSPARPTKVDGVKAPENVTECWVEACCFEGRMISPDDQLVFRPLAGDQPVPGAEKLKVHLSGFSSPESIYLKRLLKAIGGELSVKMNRHTTHLICKTTDSPKARKAPDWRIKIVKDSWLMAVGKTGALVSEEGHDFEGFPLPSAGTPHKRLSGLSRPEPGNMSMVLPLGDPTFERDPEAQQSASTPGDKLTVPVAPPSQRSMPVSPSRQLKCTPTHIDDDLAPKQEDGDKTSILASPKKETSRLLNQARGPEEVAEGKIKTAPEESVKVVRTTSAPAGSESYKRAEASSPLNPLRGSSAGSGSAKPIEKGDVTDALRMLVGQGGDPSAVKRNNRRPRPTHSKVKSTASHTSYTPSTSASPLKNMSPGAFAPEQEHGYETSPLPDDIPEEAGMQESVKVQFVDRASEKAKKQLLDVLKRGEKAAAADGKGRVKASPRSKRS